MILGFFPHTNLSPSALLVVSLSLMSPTTVVNSILSKSNELVCAEFGRKVVCQPNKGHRTEHASLRGLYTEFDGA